MVVAHTFNCCTEVGGGGEYIETSRLLDPTGSEGGNSATYAEPRRHEGGLSRPVESQRTHPSIDAVFALSTAHGLQGADRVSVLPKPPDLCGKAAQRCF